MLFNFLLEGALPPAAFDSQHREGVGNNETRNRWQKKQGENGAGGGGQGEGRGGGQSGKARRPREQSNNKNVFTS